MALGRERQAATYTWPPAPFASGVSPRRAPRPGGAYAGRVRPGDGEPRDPQRVRPGAAKVPAAAGPLTHVDAQGRARMVDVGAKRASAREAIARGRIELSAEALEVVRSGKAEKGDVLGVARIAGIQAAKRTSEWIPLCHPLPLDALEIDFALEPEPPAIAIEARARTTAKTGVEMEALVAVAAAALAIYDMCKSVDRGMVIGAVRLVRKAGGKSGTYERPGG